MMRNDLQIIYLVSLNIYFQLKYGVIGNVNRKQFQLDSAALPFLAVLTGGGRKPPRYN